MHVVLDRFAIDIWLVGVVVVVVLMVILWRRKHSLSYLVCFAVFAIYLLLAVDKLFFPLLISGDYVDRMTLVRFMRSINLIPFNFDFSFIPHIVFLQIFQNVLLTIPFGFGVNFVARVRARSFLWLAPAIGLGIETAQLIISLILGYPYRVIDVNDAILNAFGVWIGYGIFRIFAWLCVWATQRFDIRRWGLTAYIYDVASRAHARES